MADKEKYIYKRKDGRWEARYVKGISEDGKVQYGYLYGNSEQEVTKRRRNILGESGKHPTIPKKLNLLILGAGSHGRNIKEIADSLRIFNKISFLDDNVTGEDIIGTCKEAIKFRNEYICAFVAVGDNKRRKMLAEFLKARNFITPSIIATSANVSPNAVIGDGVAIMPNSTVNESVIGDFCILASNSLVNNGTTIGKFSHIDCGGIVLKGKKVPENTWVESGEIYGR